MLIKTLQTDMLETKVYRTRAEMGKAAAAAAACAIREAIAQKGEANVIFAAAPSQNEMLEALLREELDFTRIRAFHMDEYVGLSATAPQSFAAYLTAHLFAHAPFCEVFLIDACSPHGSADYAALLAQYPPDVVCMGIGENGHIAFNDPPVADFNDPHKVKVVALDAVCRMQQVHDGCFPTLEAVPTHALTLTVPALMAAKHLICTVPGPTKAQAVKAMLQGPIGEVCPATALRRHSHAVMLLDADSAAEVL